MSYETGIYLWRVSPPDKLFFEPSIHMKDSIVQPVDNPHLQSPAILTTEPLKILQSGMVVSVFQTFIEYAQNKFAKILKRGKKSVLSIP